MTNNLNRNEQEWSQIIPPEPMQTLICIIICFYDMYLIFFNSFHNFLSKGSSFVLKGFCVALLPLLVKTNDLTGNERKGRKGRLEPGALTFPGAFNLWVSAVNLIWGPSWHLSLSCSRLGWIIKSRTPKCIEYHLYRQNQATRIIMCPCYWWIISAAQVHLKRFCRWTFKKRVKEAPFFN